MDERVSHEEKFHQPYAHGGSALPGVEVCHTLFSFYPTFLSLLL